MNESNKGATKYATFNPPSMQQQLNDILYNLHVIHTILRTKKPTIDASLTTYSAVKYQRQKGPRPKVYKHKLH